MSELGELYQEVILDHNKRPRNFHPIATPDHRAVGHNPLCGDRITVYLSMDGEVLRDVAFEGSGCAISKASASLMTEFLKGRTREEAERLFRKFHALVTGNGGTAGSDDLGKLVVFAGVRDYPVRVKCATLAWHTLRAALDDRQDAVSTE
ncbi:MAG: Fe-S cluster assembly sulfur transfer protein SufU [Candidatus Polarisedimenticolia bacterium]